MWRDVLSRNLKCVFLPFFTGSLQLLYIDAIIRTKQLRLISKVEFKLGWCCNQNPYGSFLLQMYFTHNCMMQSRVHVHDISHTHVTWHNCIWFLHIWYEYASYTVYAEIFARRKIFAFFTNACCWWKFFHDFFAQWIFDTLNFPHVEILHVFSLTQAAVLFKVSLLDLQLTLSQPWGYYSPRSWGALINRAITSCHRGDQRCCDSCTAIS